MAYLYRLIALLILSALPLLSHAYPATTNAGVAASTNDTTCTVAPCYSYRARSNTGFANSPLAAAQLAIGNSLTIGGCGTITSVAATGVGTAARWTATCNAGSIPSTAFTVNSRTADAVSYTCPNGGTLSGTSCVCPTGQTDSGTACSDPAAAHCASVLGSPVKTTWTSTTPSLGTRTVCSGGGYGYYTCNATIEPDFCGSHDGVTYTCSGSGTNAGTPCTASPAPEQPVPVTDPVSSLPSPPPPGTCPGTVNGVTVNLPCTNTVSTGAKNEATNDGAGNSTVKSESRSTTCTAAGACSTTVTTVTTVNGGAPVTSTKTIDESKADFCVGNPAAKECGDGEGSSFGGSCASGFVCEGDAVQCAHAKETHLQNCKLNEDTPERQLYEASKGEDAVFDSDEVVNVGPSSFSQAAILGSASCIADKSISIMGSSVSLPFSRVCEYLAMLGNVLMAVGFLLSGRIIMRG